MNLEPWGKSHVSPPCLFCSFSLASSNHHLHLCCWLVGASICWKKDHYYTHAYSLSLHNVPFACGWSVHYEDRESVQFPHMGWVKSFHIPMFRGSLVLPCHWDCYLAVGSPLPHGFVGLRICSHRVLCLSPPSSDLCNDSTTLLLSLDRNSIHNFGWIRLFFSITHSLGVCSFPIFLSVQFLQWLHWGSGVVGS